MDNFLCVRFLFGYNRYMSIVIPPKDFSVLFLDMNSFFASVEQQVEPTLRGRSIGVAPYIGDSGCIISASKEAKVFGIKIARVGEAKKICPQIKIIEARPALYMDYHKKIRQIIESCTPYFEAMSIDEFAIHLTPRDQNYEGSVKMAEELKRKIRGEVGDYLTCSIGIGPSVFLAKMAGERHKPDGLSVVRLSELEKFYTSLSLRDLTGINWRMEMQLKNLGIDSPADLYKMPMGEMIRLLKHWGRMWYFRLRGHEVDDVMILPNRRTIGHSHVLEPEFRTKEGALGVLKKLIAKSGYRLRKEGYCAGGVSICINFINKTGFHQSKKFAEFHDDASFWKNTSVLLKNCGWQSRPILIAVSAFNLSKSTGGRQMALFDDIEKSRAVSEALDQINDEFGTNTVLTASTFQAKDSAPDRISFGRPRYDIIH